MIFGAVLVLLLKYRYEHFTIIAARAPIIPALDDLSNNHHSVLGSWRKQEFRVLKSLECLFASIS